MLLLHVRTNTYCNNSGICGILGMPMSQCCAHVTHLALVQQARLTLPMPVYRSATPTLNQLLVDLEHVGNKTCLWGESVDYSEHVELNATTYP